MHDRLHIVGLLDDAPDLTLARDHDAIGRAAANGKRPGREYILVGCEIKPRAELL